MIGHLKGGRQGRIGRLQEGAVTDGRAGKPRIRDIAEALGVSIGTVDRALNDRPRISAATRKKILNMAEALGYRPNLAARYLSSRRELRIAVALPREVASFWDLVRDGMREALRHLEAKGVRIVDHAYPRLGVGEREALEQALRENADAVVIAPGQPDLLKPLIKQAAERGIPVLCVNTDAPGTRRLATVCVDPVASGSLAAELLARFVHGDGAVVAVTGLFTTIDHARKLDGFRAQLRRMRAGLRLLAVVEAHDEEREAYEKCREAFAAHADLAAVYVSTANSLPVLSALKDEGLADRTILVTTDLFPALARAIQSGRVAATIHQRPWTQGRIALQTIYRFLSEGLRPPPLVRLSPHVVMRSNLRLFRETARPPRRSAGAASGANADAAAVPVGDR
jgi:LacI family transcriptional regulator